MSQHYSDPSRENDQWALPDVEVWQDKIVILRTGCGEFEVGQMSEYPRGFCPSCERATCVNSLATFDPSESGIQHTDKTGWFYQFCFPGCLPDSDPFGPFQTEQEAINDMRDTFGDN